eukprot:6829636-Lingulodinium_polyedra.AAC.1
MRRCQERCEHAQAPRLVAEDLFAFLDAPVRIRTRHLGGTRRADIVNRGLPATGNEGDNAL